MTTEQKTLPKWILIISGFFALMEFVASMLFIFAPQSMADTVDLEAKGVNFLLLMWASRQFALGFIFAFATIKKSNQMLTVAYIFLLVMLLGDLCIGIKQHDSSQYLGAGVMCLIPATVIYFLNKQSS
jgi:hypothetical protein